uniref:Consortin, connexin sorting protein n=1 Tax=Nannospalax galili TaxID=1026970 RepID=A0A8C6QDC1_NANGA
MDDSDTPTYGLQIEPQDGCQLGDSVERRVTGLPSVSDENENQLDGDGPEPLTDSNSAMGKPEVLEQDSLNNNEGCLPGWEAAASENAEDTPCDIPRDDQPFLGKDKKLPEKRSARAKKGTAKNILPGDAIPLTQGTIPSTASQALDEEAAEVNANDPPEAPTPALQPLFSFIRGEVEQMDSRALPLFLHQSGLYFPQIFYSDEKAMKFIQLERLYHEQLLANLSAIQEQWETKWKAAEPRTVMPLRNSEKGFNSEDFEQLAKFCTTHQDCIVWNFKTVHFSSFVETETYAGMESSKESRHKEPRESSPSCHQMDWQAASPSLPVTAGKDHREELLCSTEATLALHTQSPETARSRSGPVAAAENACKDGSCLQAPPTEDHPSVAQIEGITEDPIHESVREPLALPGCDCPPPLLVSEGKYSQTHRKELHLPLQDVFEAFPRSQQEKSELSEPQQPDLTASDGKSPQNQTDSETGSESALCDDSKISDLNALLLEECMAPEERREREDQVSKETEDYLKSLLEGCSRDTEESLFCEDNQDDDSDLPQDLSPEEASYSLQESLPCDDTCLSLDDLAKRIEIAEVVPAEGLVSILKKRNDSVGEHPAQMQQKPSKRRVRFQEIDDSLDQDEVGGGSCILLILLCIATVFLSVGGTALYCTLGNMESPVCTDFADNVDFYYTRLVQGMAELKHWIYLS